jgi:hypothetical protein
MHTNSFLPSVYRGIHQTAPKFFFCFPSASLFRPITDAIGRLLSSVPVISLLPVYIWRIIIYQGPFNFTIMKKFFLAGLFIFIATVFFTMSNYAQISANIVDGNHSLTAVKKSIRNFDRNSFPASHLSEINIKAVRNFERFFKGAENKHWYSVDNGLIVYFTDNGIKGRANYNNNGRWLSTIRCYAEDRLPKDVRAQVKREYYDYTITWVNEISNETQLYYIVHMQDKTSWKNILVYDGEMGVVEDFVKY